MRGTTLERGATPTVPLSRAARSLMDRGDQELSLARGGGDAAERFTHAHVAALRYAGAVIAARRPAPRRGRDRSAWQQLTLAEPALSSWAAFFSAGAPLRAAIEVGRGEQVREQDADEWVVAAQQFSDDVWEALTGQLVIAHTDELHSIHRAVARAS